MYINIISSSSPEVPASGSGSTASVSFPWLNISYDDPLDAGLQPFGVRGPLETSRDEHVFLEETWRGRYRWRFVRTDPYANYVCLIEHGMNQLLCSLSALLLDISRKLDNVWRRCMEIWWRSANTSTKGCTRFYRAVLGNPVLGSVHGETSADDPKFTLFSSLLGFLQIFATFKERFPTGDATIEIFLKFHL